ncbi:unnamed protein product [Polarella glacialis]|uniref:Uncharacterized protein n=1 Tax=Polarella glacialis TaxID=89957 RepID=A0A813HI05_POLGL|nr:unnamed protein product [Polarella glacialis]
MFLQVFVRVVFVCAYLPESKRIMIQQRLFCLILDFGGQGYGLVNSILQKNMKTQQHIFIGDRLSHIFFGGENRVYYYRIPRFRTPKSQKALTRYPDSRSPDSRHHKWQYQI